MPSETRLALIERKLVDVTHVEHLPAVELILSPLSSKVVRILRSAEIILSVRDSMGVRVVHGNQGTSGEVLLHADLQSVIIGVEPRGKGIDSVVTEERPNPVQSLRVPIGDRRRDTRRNVRQRLRFINVNYADKMRAFVSEVAGINKPFVPDLTLHVQAPFLDVGLLPIGFLHGQRRWQEIQVGNDAARIVEHGIADRNVLCERWIAELAVFLCANAGRIIKDSKAGSDGRLPGFEGIPGNANSWGEILG